MKRSVIVLFGIFILLISCRDVVREYDRVLNERKTDKLLLIQPAISYSGDSLKNIAYPVGGIGTGNVLMGGRGNILEWEIFGKADQDELPPYMTFFAIHIDKGDGNPVNRVLEGVIPEDQPNPFGVPRQQLTGIPRFSECHFQSDFPFARTKLSDRDLPLGAALTTWSPFIPLETAKSSMPLAVFDWEIENTGTDSLKLFLAFSFGNPFTNYSRPDEDFSGKVVTVQNETYQGVKFQKEIPVKEEFIVFCKENNIHITNKWYRGGWWDNAQVFWESFREKGFAKPASETYSFNESSGTDVATISVPFVLGPGEKDTISFLAAWRIPERKAERSMALGSGQEPGKKYLNYYALPFSKVEDIVDRFYQNFEELHLKTQTFRDLIFASTFPQSVIDALASNLYALRSNLIMRDGNGRVHAFEGLGNDFGCCPGNCTHVWNYAQSLAFLFPDLERDMRETNFLHDTHPDGAMSFRTVFPPGNYWMNAEAADGQMGTIIRAYREWKISGDSEWLQKIWPGVKKALEFAWKGKHEGGIAWDPKKEGVIRGNQHNTYDINFFGPNMLTGSLYLGALKAASEMASELGETGLSEEYHSLFLSGRAKYEEILWNGEYYEQKVEVLEGIDLPSNYKLPTDESGKILPKYQFESGCLSDQLLGQFLAEVSGLGSLLDSVHINRALQSIYRFNFIRDFSHFENIQRVYAYNNEAGLVLCSWPSGDKPTVPFVYSDEVWTGVEYQVAASLIYRGMVQEGLELVAGVRDRYRGFNRNPYAEIESGRYYARSLSNWALLTSLSGYHYDGVEKYLSFHPKLNRDRFFTFWSTGNAWGSFEIRNKGVFLTVFHGELDLEKFAFEHSSPDIQEVSTGGYQVSSEEGFHHLKFNQSNKFSEGMILEIGMK